MDKKLIYILFIAATLVTACDMFSTRNPEAPDTDRSSYKPPTDASIVISNFKNAISEKNIENYMRCFLNNSSDSSDEYSFTPSADGYSMYPGIFDHWGAEEERAFFKSLNLQLPTGITPLLELTNEQTNNPQPNSWIYTYNYKLVLDTTNSNLSKKYSGTMQLTLVLLKSGYWYIANWSDFKSKDDTTWSILKGQYSN